MLFQKQDLEGNHYVWNKVDNHIYKGQPSRRAFDRFDGDQVLFLINFYGTLLNQFTLSEGRAIEEKIFRELPTDAKSEIAVFNWIRNTDIFKKN